MFFHTIKRQCVCHFNGTLCYNSTSVVLWHDSVIIKTNNKGMWAWLGKTRGGEKGMEKGQSDLSNERRLKWHVKHCHYEDTRADNAIKSGEHGPYNVEQVGSLNICPELMTQLVAIGLSVCVKKKCSAFCTSIKCLFVRRVLRRGSTCRHQQSTIGWTQQTHWQTLIYWVVPSTDRRQ